MMRGALSILGAALTVVGAFLYFGVSCETEPDPLFFGELWLREGMTSKVVLRPRPHDVPDAPRGSLEIAERAGVDLLPLFPERPPGLKDLQQIYEAVELPFSVRLSSITFEETGVSAAEVTLSAADREQRVPYAAGTRIVLGDRPFVMREIRPWGGLISEPAESGGAPLAVLGIRQHEEDWVEDIVAEDGDWLRLADELVFRFCWTESEAVALASINDGVPGLESARWGVEENGAMNWFESFVPGTGLQLSDGTEVVLAEVRQGKGTAGREEAAIRFKVVREGKVEDVWVSANGTAEEGLLRFVYPTLERFVAMGYSWQPDFMLIVLFENGEEAGRYVLERGQIQALGRAQCMLRLDQVLGSAVYLARQDSPLTELVLESDEQLLCLRQGETLSVNGDTVTFSPAVSEKHPVYTLEIEFADGKTERFALHRDSLVRVGKWSVQQAAGAEVSEHWVSLYLERERTAPYKDWGLSMLGMGAVLLLMANAVSIWGRLRRTQRG